MKNTAREYIVTIKEKQIFYAIVFIICVIMSFLFAGCSKKDEKHPESDTPDIQVATPLVSPVVVYSSYPGELTSLSEAAVVARVNGQILSKHFQDGATVVKGQLLFTIEPTMYSSSVAEAQAQLESARGQLQYAEKHLKALEEGLRADAVSEMDVIQARSAKAEAQAAVNQYSAALKAASTKLGYCRITAPISGKISSATVDVGGYVNGDGAPVTLAKIYNDNDLAVDFSIPDYEYNAIESSGAGFADSLYRNIPIIFTSASGGSGTQAPEKRCTASLSYQSPQVDSSTGSVSVRAKVNPGYKDLKAGMYCKVQLPGKLVPDAILVKDASISTDQRGKYLYTLNDSNKVVYTPVKVGELYHDTLRMITSGISADTRYVTRAMISVRNGEKVKPVLVKTAN